MSHRFCSRGYTNLILLKHKGYVSLPLVLLKKAGLKVKNSVQTPLVNCLMGSVLTIWGHWYSTVSKRVENVPIRRYMGRWEVWWEDEANKWISCLVKPCLQRTLGLNVCVWGWRVKFWVGVVPANNWQSSLCYGYTTFKLWNWNID